MSALAAPVPAPRFAGKVPKELNAAGPHRLPDGAVILFAELSDTAGRSGRCWKSNATLADDLGCSTKSVRRWMAALVRAGWVTREHRYLPSGQTSNRYVLPDIVGRYATLDRDLRRSGQLTRRAMCLLAYLGDVAGASGTCRSRQDTIARDLNCSIDSVQRAVAELIAAGLLTVTANHTAWGRRASNTYALEPDRTRDHPATAPVTTEDSPLRSCSSLAPEATVDELANDQDRLPFDPQVEGPVARPRPQLRAVTDAERKPGHLTLDGKPADVRVQKWLGDQLLDRGDRPPDDASLTDYYRWLGNALEREVDDGWSKRAARIALCREFIEHQELRAFGESTTMPEGVRKRLARVVADAPHVGTVICAIEEANRCGAGCDEKYADDPAAFVKYVAAVVKGGRARA